MDFAMDLIKASHVGIKEMKANLTRKLLRNFLVITDRGKPVSINLPYSDVEEIMDIFEELSDPETVTAVFEARKARKTKGKGVSVIKVFEDFRRKRK